MAMWLAGEPDHARNQLSRISTLVGRLTTSSAEETKALGAAVRGLANKRPEETAPFIAILREDVSPEVF